MAPLKINNRTARHLWLETQGLGRTPTGAVDVCGLIEGLGFVQLDTIQVIARAHHHILWSRNQNYREPMLQKTFARDRRLFEHFTHDASILPMTTLPVWRRQFRRKRMQLERSSWFSAMLDEKGRAAIRQRIENEGPLSTHAFDTKVRGVKQMWARPPHKLALDFMWYSGELATSHREGFTKFYDVAERVFPAALWDSRLGEDEEVDWLCHGALNRLGLGSPGEIQKFWDATGPQDVRRWIGATPSLVPVEVESADGSWTKAFAPADIETRLAGLAAPTSRLRIVNPFDPVIRDRQRIERLFGFNYRVEMFVPAAKRIWGYYVYPLLEGARFVGRLEAKADRSRSVLNVTNVWREPGVEWTRARAGKLDAELYRLRRFVGVSRLDWQCARQPVT